MIGTQNHQIRLDPSVKSNVGGVGGGEWAGLPEEFPRVRLFPVSRPLRRGGRDA